MIHITHASQTQKSKNKIAESPAETARRRTTTEIYYPLTETSRARRKNNPWGWAVRRATRADGTTVPDLSTF